ncbi:hypothetical protein FRC08_003986 [Ceratobasidium sp. 394]|nr:hypothetical protein FRC08_003986 [Ceratobasidium sp. 394]
MPPKRKSAVKATLHRVEKGLRRLFRDRERTLPDTESDTWSHIDLSNTDWAGLERFSRVLEANSGAVGPLKLAIDRFSKCVKTFEEQAMVRPEYLELGTDLNDLFHALAERFEKTDLASTTLDTFANLARSVDNEIEPLESYKQGEPEDADGATQDIGRVLKSYRRIRTILALFAMSESMKMWKLGDDEILNTRVEGLLHAPNAHYRATGSKGTHRTGCMPNTRVAVLQDLTEWVHYGKLQKVYWLSGIAGTGKTTVAYSLCEWLENSGKPFASFFCSRDLPDCRDVKRIIPSVAYQLAQLSRPFRCAVSSALEQDPDVCNRPVGEQFQALIAAPLQSVGHTFGLDVAIVLDALDQCEDRDGVNQVLDACFNDSSNLPVRFLITSRRNPGILERMMASQPGQRRAQLRLHEIDRTVARDDIRTYFRARLEGLELSDGDIEFLVQRSGGWFLYAASVADYLVQEDVAEGSERLKRLVDISLHTESTHNRDMDVGFTAILEQVVGQTVRDDSRLTDAMLFLRTTLCAQEPMSMETIAGLLGLEFDYLVHTVLHPLLPVLQVPSANEMAIGLCDSFGSYLLDPQRSGRFHCDVQRNRALLARSCFAVFDTASPAFNVCNLNSSYLLDREVPCIDERVNESISGPMWYASRHWATHLKLAGALEDHLSLLHKFLSRRLLLWMEVVNLKHYNSQAVELLNGVDA